MLYKNTASQKIAVFAYTAATGAAKTGDAAQITAYISKDFAAGAAIADTNPTEMDATNMPGWYAFDLTQAETNGNVLIVAPKSSTSGVVLDQAQVFTTASVDQTGDSYARLGAPAGASVSADIAVIESQTDDIGAAGAGLTAIPWNAVWDTEVQSEAADALIAYDPPTNAEMEARTILAAAYFDPAADTVAAVTTVGSVTNGVTISGTLGSLDALWAKIQKWLRLTLRKDAAVAADHAVELAEINANGGSGAGAYVSTTDSQEAIKDSLGGTPLSAQEVRDAMKLAPTAGAPAAGSIDKQLDDVPADVDTALSASHGAGLWGGASGSGAVECEITVNDGVNPVDGAEVWVTTDLAGSNVVASGVSDALGLVTVWLDSGTYYIFKQLSGYTFTNPETMVVT